MTQMGTPYSSESQRPRGEDPFAGLNAGTLAAWALLTWRLFDVGEPMEFANHLGW